MYKSRLPEFVQKSIEAKLSKYCDSKIPVHVRDKLRLEYVIDGQSVTLVERRPHFQNKELWTSCPFAKFTYVKSSNEWKLYCSDQNGKWHNFKNMTSKVFDDLLEEVERDSTGIFYG
jgi:hypothetical protein